MRGSPGRRGSVNEWRASGRAAVRGGRARYGGLVGMADCTLDLAVTARYSPAGLCASESGGGKWTADRSGLGSSATLLLLPCGRVNQRDFAEQ